MLKSGINYRLVNDYAGSVRLVVDSSGTIAERIDYDEYGNITNDTAPGFQPFAFAGGVRDLDTGLIRFGSRDYDSVTGRWTSSDALRFNGGSTNLLTYAGNDPINRIDPGGTLLGPGGGAEVGAEVGAAVGGPVGAVVGGMVGCGVGTLLGYCLASPS